MLIILACDFFNVMAVSGTGVGYVPFPGNTYPLPATLQLSAPINSPGYYVTARLQVNNGFVIPSGHFIKFSGIGFGFSN
jgi:hypothetical protein